MELQEVEEVMMTRLKQFVGLAAALIFISMMTACAPESVKNRADGEDHRASTQIEKQIVALAPDQVEAVGKANYLELETKMVQLRDKLDAAYVSEGKTAEDAKREATAYMNAELQSADKATIDKLKRQIKDAYRAMLEAKDQTTFENANADYSTGITALKARPGISEAVVAAFEEGIVALYGPIEEE
jgi:hypothetical protein